LIFRGRYFAAVITSIIFFGIPMLSERELPWNMIVPLVLVGLGISVLIRGLMRKEEGAK